MSSRPYLLNSRSAQPLGSIPVIQNVSLTIAGFRALIGELFPIISFQPSFPYQIHRTLLGTYIALLRMMLLFGPRHRKCQERSDSK